MQFMFATMGMMGSVNAENPKPGMLVKASEDYKIDLAQSYMVGDRSKDIDAGNASEDVELYLLNITIVNH